MEMKLLNRRILAVVCGAALFVGMSVTISAQQSQQDEKQYDQLLMKYRHFSGLTIKDERLGMHLYQRSVELHVGWQKSVCDEPDRRYEGHCRACPGLPPFCPAELSVRHDPRPEYARAAYA